MSSKLNIGSVIWNATTGVEVGTIVNSTQLDLKANKAQEAWIAPTLLNGWVNYGSVYETAGFYKDDMGRVHLKGFIKDGATTAGLNIFVLPVGYRPSAVQWFVCALTGGTVGRIGISPNGDVSVITVSSQFTALDGISFKAGN